MFYNINIRLSFNDANNNHVDRLESFVMNEASNLHQHDSLGRTMNILKILNNEL